MMKKAINILLIMILSITFLPLQEVGKLLSSNKMVEELSPEAHDSKSTTNYGSEVIHFHHDFICSIDGTSYVSQEFLQLADNIPSHPSVEIHVPPPNC